MWKEEVRGDLTSAYITKLANTQSDTFLESMLFSKDPSNTIMLRDIVMKESPEAWEAVQGSFMKHLMWKNSTVKSIGDDLVATEVKAKGILKDLARIEGKDKAGLAAIFPDRSSKGGTVFAGFRRYVQAMETQQRMSAAGSGAMFMQLKQAGAISAMAGAGAAAGGASIGFGATAGASTGIGLGAAAATGATFLVAPWALGRIWSNPAAVQWLTVGLKNAPGTVKGTKASISMIGLMLKEKFFASPEESEAALQYSLDLSKDLSSRGIKP
jgi:hypothetical protein